MLDKKEKEREEIILKLRKISKEIDELYNKIDEKMIKMRGTFYELGRALNKDFGK